jgi:SsrA-binding protein
VASSKKTRKPKPGDDPDVVPVTRNRKARHEFEVLDDLECGIVLTGSEVKSIRDGKISIDEAFARVSEGELWLVDAFVHEYPQANVMNHEPKRRRKLLLHRKELRDFAGSASQSGLTLVPLDLYFRRGVVKVRIALCRGRKLHDKREKLRQQDDRREMREAKLAKQ